MLGPENDKQKVLLYLTLYIIYKIKVMFLQNWYHCCSPVDKCDVPCLSGNVSVFAYRNYNLDRKLKTQI
jgi:hypothetical protein